MNGNLSDQLKQGIKFIDDICCLLFFHRFFFFLEKCRGNQFTLLELPFLGDLRLEVDGSDNINQVLFKSLRSQ